MQIQLNICLGFLEPLFALGPVVYAEFQSVPVRSTSFFLHFDYTMQNKKRGLIPKIHFYELSRAARNYNFNLCATK